MTAINLLPMEYCRRRTTSRRGRVWAQVLVVATAGAAMTIAVCLSMLPATAALQLNRTRLAVKSDQILRQVAEQATAFEERADGVSLLKRVGMQPDFASLLNILGDWCVEGVRLESVSIQASHATRAFEGRLVGVCDTADLATLFLECARTSGLCDSITLAGTRRVESAEGAYYRFELRFTLAGFADQAEVLR